MTPCATRAASRRLPGRAQQTANVPCALSLWWAMLSPPADGRAPPPSPPRLGDTLRVPSRGYRRISDKVISALQWAAEDHAEAEYVLKTDDDSFVCVTRLLERLHRVRAGLVGIACAGARRGGGVRRGGRAGRRVKFTRHPVPVELREGNLWEDSAYVESFGRRVYPLYAQGAGYASRVGEKGQKAARPPAAARRGGRAGRHVGAATPRGRLGRRRNARRGVRPARHRCAHRNPKTYCRRTLPYRITFV